MSLLLNSSTLLMRKKSTPYNTAMDYVGTTFWVWPSIFVFGGVAISVMNCGCGHSSRLQGVVIHGVYVLGYNLCIYYLRLMVNYFYVGVAN